MKILPMCFGWLRDNLTFFGTTPIDTARLGAGVHGHANLALW
jgi:hypothetical protein